MKLDIYKYQTHVWVLYVLVPIFTCFLCVRSLPGYEVETADDKAEDFEVLEVEGVEYGPEGLQTETIATRWRDRETGVIYSLDDEVFLEFVENENDRLFWRRLIYVILGCLIYTIFKKFQIKDEWPYILLAGGFAMFVFSIL